MEIYKLNIDTAKPTNQVLAMQQNSASMLSIDLTNNGKYIRNLSCMVFDGSTEISESKYGYKVNVGNEPKHISIVAKSQPYECSAEYVVSSTGVGSKSVFLSRVQLKAGTYSQDEFQSLTRFGDRAGYAAMLVPNVATENNANFNRIIINIRNPYKQIWFADASGNLPDDEPIVVSADMVLGMTTRITGRAYTLSSYNYPAIGYYTDYQIDTLIKPSQNTTPYATIEYDPSNIEAGNISADIFTLSGVTYVPTTLSVDGVAYSVLAAPIEQS